LINSMQHCALSHIRWSSPYARQRWPDIGFAHRSLNWQPRTELSEGLQRTIEHFGGIIGEVT